MATNATNIVPTVDKEQQKSETAMQEIQQNAPRTTVHNDSSLFSGKMKLADLILTNYRLLHVFQRLGIHLGFGEISVEETCQRNGISLPFFLMICNIYTFDDYLPAPTQLDAIDITDIVSYLQISHHYYTENRIPRLKEQLSMMSASCEPIHHKIMGRFFEDYQQELLNHFRYEEEIVFPYIRRIATGENAAGYSISQFEENHSNIEEKLDDLKNIILKYLPESCCSERRNELLCELFQLGEDLNKHTLIENKVLIPFVAKLEKEGKNGKA